MKNSDKWIMNDYHGAITPVHQLHHEDQLKNTTDLWLRFEITIILTQLNKVVVSFGSHCCCGLEISFIIIVIVSVVICVVVSVIIVILVIIVVVLHNFT